MNEIFAKLFSLLYRSNMYNELLEQNLYAFTGFMMIGVIAIFASIYYFGMNHARFAYRFYWFMTLLLTNLVMFLVTFVYTRRTLTFEGLGDFSTTEYFVFAIIVCLYTSLFFFLFSLIIKNFSLQLKKIPF